MKIFHVVSRKEKLRSILGCTSKSTLCGADPTSQFLQAGLSERWGQHLPCSPCTLVSEGFILNLIMQKWLVWIPKYEWFLGNMSSSEKHSFQCHDFELPRLFDSPKLY
jgi:hypothetical protein